MKSGSLKSSLLKLMILVPLTLDNIVQSAVNGENHHRSGRKMNLTHAVKMSQKFVCKEPQSRAYNLRDLMRDVQQNSGESPVKPVYVVLKRCDGHSGCCTSPDMSCSPEPSAIYYDEIEIEVSSLVHRKTIPRWIRVEQHGRCFCDVTTINDRYQQELQWPNVTLV
ncbi:uncharacterized protein LOC105663651 [Megachile rotundata]|uniref:uncharacterized protein LOC105663651 n=1 Tax=Megachile rotundata TaxID=143995 RepID=UPI000614BDC3|nr:PREDICTED: uncharacterized protein LOC105663651 [Megachile rotundata]